MGQPRVASHRHQLAVFVIQRTDPWSLVETDYSLNCFGKVEASTKALGSVTESHASQQRAVTDHRILKAQGRTYLAAGISLDVTCDLKGQGPGVWPAVSTCTENSWLHMKKVTSRKLQATSVMPVQNDSKVELL